MKEQPEEVADDQRGRGKIRVWDFGFSSLAVKENQGFGFDHVLAPGGDGEERSALPT